MFYSFASFPAYGVKCVTSDDKITELIPPQNKIHNLTNLTSIHWFATYDLLFHDTSRFLTFSFSACSCFNKISYLETL